MIQARRLLAVLLAMALGFGVAACGSDSDSGSGDSDSGNAAKVEGQTWKLMNIATAGAATSIPSNVKTPTFEFSDGTVNVFAGCNSGTGKAEIGDKTITFGPVALTKKSCGTVPNQIETYVTMGLKGEVDYKLDQGNLVLEGKPVSLVLTSD
jgi:heat shock protein HslJ